VLCIWLLITSAAAQDAGFLPNTSETGRSGSGKWVKLTPESLNFGSQKAETETSPQSVSVTNTGTTAITIADILTSGIDFNQTNNCPSTLAPAANCQIQVTFKPATTGDRMATLQIDDSDPMSPQTIVLTGTGQ
jgi:hypothetical protein